MGTEDNVNPASAWRQPEFALQCKRSEPSCRTHTMGSSAVSLYITLACHRSIDEQIFSTPRPAIGVDDKSWSGPGRSHKFNNDLRSWFSPVGSLID